MSSEPSRLDRARELAESSLPLAVVPMIASLLSVGRIERVLAADPGFGVSFALPTGLPTLWTFTDVPGGSVGGPVVPDFGNAAVVIVGLAVTAALEAGFLGSLVARTNGRRIDRDRFLLNVGRFGVRMIAVRLVTFTAVALIVLLGGVFLPLAVVGAIAVSYGCYGWPYVVVVRDESALDALGITLALARNGGAYLAFAVAHVVGAAIVSLPVSLLVRNGGLIGILLAAGVTALPALFAAAYGVLLFRGLSDPEAGRVTGERPSRGGTASSERGPTGEYGATDDESGDGVTDANDPTDDDSESDGRRRGDDDSRSND